VSYKEQTPPFLYEEENYLSKIETTMTSGPYYNHSAPKYFVLGFISRALLLDFKTSLAIFFYSVNFTVACPSLPVNSLASSRSVCSSGLLTSDDWTKGVNASTKLLDLVATLAVCLGWGGRGDNGPVNKGQVLPIEARRNAVQVCASTRVSSVVQHGEKFLVPTKDRRP
jgi:hypothetical protein